MRLSNIFEAPLTPSPEMGMNPAPKPGSAQAAAAVSGANALRGVTGVGGTSVAKALGALGDNKALSPNLAKALHPYADALTTILSDPQMRTKFVQLVKQAQAVEKEAPAENIEEDQDSVDAVASSITRRIMMQHTDLLSKYGPVKVMAAIDDVADFAGSDGLDEIGSSDVSIWTKQVIQDLEAGHYDRVEEDEQIDELSNGTLGSYVKKAADSTRINTRWAARTGDRDAEDIVDRRRKGIDKAVDKMTKEEAEDEVDTVTMDVPLMIRMLEYAREDAKDDMDLHDAVERMIAMSKDGPLSMENYDSIVGSVEELPAPVDEVSNKTLSSYTDKAAKERDAYHADRNKDAESARKYHNRKAGVRKALSVTKEDYYAPGPETMPGAVGPQENTTVSFNQSKTIGDATLNINASAKDMEELHRILKLAGVNYDSGASKQEPSMNDVAVALAPHAPEAPAEEPCGCQDEEPTDVKYSTDRQTLINVLRDKLQKRLA